MVFLFGGVLYTIGVIGQELEFRFEDAFYIPHLYSGGLNLDLKELEIKKPLYMTILIGQYITGLVCLAYIANYIISK